MKPEDFVKAYYEYAKQVEDAIGLSAISILAQAALESGWGEAAPGNMFFGVKDTDGINGNEQLLTTTEYHRTPDVKYPVIISITPVERNGQKYFKYRIKDYFRKYPTPYECFVDHANFLMNNERYVRAWRLRQYPEKFIVEIAKAGYATDPNYAEKLLSIVNRIRQCLKGN